jgi:hypothetical protein
MCGFNALLWGVAYTWWSMWLFDVDNPLEASDREVASQTPDRRVPTRSGAGSDPGESPGTSDARQVSKGK